jgi:hypothetical protein
LHGTFVLATAEGIEIIAAEERYRRTPQEEVEHRAAAISFAKSLQDEPGLIDPKAASFVLETAEEIGRGANPDRSGVIASGTVKNVAIVVSTAGALGALSVTAVALGSPVLIAGSVVSALVLGEGLKKSKAFTAVTGSITKGLDIASDADVANVLSNLREKFRPQLRFVLRIEPQLRGLANQRKEFDWINGTLDWIKQQEPFVESSLSAESITIETLPTTLPEHIRAKITDIVSTNLRSSNPTPIVLKVGENVDDSYDVLVRTFEKDGITHTGLHVLVPNSSLAKGSR